MIRVKRRLRSIFMRYMRPLIILLAVLVALCSCSRDPNVVKKRYLDSGNKYFEKGKLKEASIMYRNALQKDMRYGPAHYKLGLTNLRLGQLAPAVQSLRRAVELLPADQPDHWDAAIKLSEIYLGASPEKQYLEEVEGYIKQLLKRDPNSYDGHRLSGDLNFVQSASFVRTGQKDPARLSLQQAIAEYRKADSIKPAQTGVDMQLARALSALGDATGAEALYRRLMARSDGTEHAFTELYRLLMLTGKPDEAEKVLRLGFQHNGKQFGFLTMLAAHFYNQKRLTEMVAVLKEIESHSKDFPGAYVAVGDFYLRMGDNDSAIREYREGIAQDAANKANYQKRIIEVLMRQGKKEDASEINAEVLKADPNDSDARGLAATLLLDKGEINRALSELQAVVARTPNNPVAHFNLGRAHEARSDWEQARQEFQKAVELRPDYLLARISLAQLQLRRREWEGALRSAEQVMAADKSNLNAHLIQAAALLGQKKYFESRAVLDEMAKHYADSADVYYQLGLVDLAERKFKDAEDRFRKSWSLNSTTTRALMGIVESYLDQNKIPDALSMLTAEADKSPKRIDLQLSLATTAVLAGQYDLAVGRYQKVLEALQDPKARADVYLRMGETYRRKGDLAQSIAALNEAKKVMGDNPLVLSTLALSLDGMGQKTNARQIYESALKADPNNGVALNNLAYLLAEGGGDLDQALTFAQRAKQLLPNVGEVSDTLGLIYLRKNLSDNAIDIFKELVNREPGRSTYRYHLGMAFSQKGDRPRALSELQQALRQNPPQEEKQKIQQLMGRLG